MLALRLLTSLGLAASIAVPAAATTISFQNGVGGYASADNGSHSFDGTITQDQIRMDLPSASQPEGSWAWVVFGDIVGPSAVPEGTTVLSATFEGYVRNPFDAAQLTRLLDHVDNRPFGPGANILDAAGVFWDAAQLLSIFHGPCSDAVECVPPLAVSFDVTAIVQSWVDGAPNYGFLFLPGTTNGGKLFATDAVDPALRPRLVIEYGGGGVSVPEPALLTLLVLAFVIAAARRS
jgi:hypothetical protein